jgi:hypothetical protein
MSYNIWLGTLSPPYERPEYWVAGYHREKVESALIDEYEERWGVTVNNPEWNNSTGGYAWLKDVKASVELRRIELLD